MTPWQNRVTALTRRMADDMKLRNYSQKTIDTYTYHVGRFAQHLGKSLEQASPEDVRSFQLHLIEVRKVGWSSFNQAVCGLEICLQNGPTSGETIDVASNHGEAQELVRRASGAGWRKTLGRR